MSNFSVPRRSLMLGGAALALAPTVAIATTSPDIGKPAPLFTAVDSNGKTWSLADLKGKVVVLETTNHDCPYVRKHYNGKNMQAQQREADVEAVRPRAGRLLLGVRLKLRQLLGLVPVVVCDVCVCVCQRVCVRVCCARGEDGGRKPRRRAPCARSCVRAARQQTPTQRAAAPLSSTHLSAPLTSMVAVAALRESRARASVDRGCALVGVGVGRALGRQQLVW